MPIIRKIINFGTCKAITLPISWLRFFEKELGTQIKYVAIEVDKKLIIEPYVSQVSQKERG